MTEENDKPTDDTPAAKTPAKAKAAEVAEPEIEGVQYPASFEARVCEACGRSTGQAMCQHCGFNPEHEEQRAKDRAEERKAAAAA